MLLKQNYNLNTTRLQMILSIRIRSLQKIKIFISIRVNSTCFTVNALLLGSAGLAMETICRSCLAHKYHNSANCAHLERAAAALSQQYKRTDFMHALPFMYYVCCSIITITIQQSIKVFREFFYTKNKHHKNRKHKDLSKTKIFS